jgi:type II secretory pathway component GspD/PulD (secretin)
VQLGGILTNNEDGDSLSVVFDYLNMIGESELLSAPRVTTMNQKPAVIVDLTTRTFVTNVLSSGTVVGGGGLAGTSDVFTTNIPIQQQFIEGITLSVTPQISEDQIRLWLNPQVTEIIGEDRFTSTQQLGTAQPTTQTFSSPIMSTQSVWTNVIVKDGDTLVLGGLVKDKTIKSEERLPYLHQIPVLGFFFKGKSRVVDQASLLIFVTADIIDITGSKYFESDV